ncbi:PIG-L family deacetylase [Natronomonas sp. F2-12]|uniref:PIG-L family deacetylase n=1 Tax=Natronomonas aquatica TaxID=2841590 RepID=A0A9R1CUG1_9EURY|nr:PIG-L deacetylase family protein [Natronomonas aquatica]MCQ4333831.1 PIG-L family deacetylase [Natronomonas aquatica]
MSVLCIVAHPDDEVLGVGGTLARHTAEGDDVHICILSDGVTSRYEDTDAADAEIERRRERAERAARILGATVSLHDFPDNRFDTAPLLDIVQTIEAEITEHNPDIVYTHHYGDLNVDHELACQATVTATRPLADSSVDRVLAFETLSATEWSVPKPDNAFQPTSFVNVNQHLDTKIDALSVYEAELRDSPHPRTIATVRQNTEVWGSKAGVPAAEPFEILREVRR